MSAVLLRRIFSSSVDFYDKLDPAFQQEMKNDLLKGIGDEEVQTIRKKVCDAVAELSRSLLGKFTLQDRGSLLSLLSERRERNLRSQSFNFLLCMHKLCQHVTCVVLCHAKLLHTIKFLKL